MDTLLKNLSGIQALALTIFGEARGEPIEGQIAVGCVVRNRLRNNPSKYQSYHDVIFERLQFSCWNTNDPNYPRLLGIAQKLTDNRDVGERQWKQCLWVAQGIVNVDVLDNTKSSLNYITRNLWNSNDKPTWAKNADINTEKGNHVFFTA